MQLNETEMKVLLNTYELGSDHDRKNYLSIVKTLSNDLQRYQNKNLLLINYKNEINGTKTPFVMFGQYGGLDSLSVEGREMRFIFKKPILLAEIKVNEQNIRKSFTRFRWCKMGQSYPKFREVDGFNISVYTSRNTGLLYKNELVYDADIEGGWYYSNSYPLRNNATIWALVAGVFEKKINGELNYGSLYDFFEYKYMTDRSFS